MARKCATCMTKYWATCAPGLQFTVCKELKGLEGTGAILDSLFSGGVLFETMCPAEKLLCLRSVDNIYAFVAHFQDLPTEKDAAISFLKGLAVKVDWNDAFYIFKSWNKDQVGNSLLRHSLDGDGSISFRVSCDRTCTEMKRHEFTSVDAEAAIGEGIHYLFGWPASMRMYDLEVAAWIRDAEVLMAISLLSNWNRGVQESSDVCNHQDTGTVPDLLGSLIETRTSSAMGGTILRPRPSRMDSQLYARRLYRKALVETSLKPSTAFSLLQLGEVQHGHLILDPMCGCGTIPLEAAEYFSGQVMCLGGDASPRAVAAAESNLRRSTRVRQWLCPKVLREMIRVLALNTGLVVLMAQGRFMRKEVEINQNRFLRLLKHLDVQMEGIRVEVFIMQRTSELVPDHDSSYNTKSLAKKNVKKGENKQFC